MPRVGFKIHPYLMGVAIVVGKGCCERKAPCLILEMLAVACTASTPSEFSLITWTAL